MHLEQNILALAKKASLSIQYDNNKVLIRPTIRLTDKSFWGVLLFFLGGVFFITIAVFKTADNWSIYITAVVGLFFLLISIFTILKQVADYIRIEKGTLYFRFNLKSYSIKIEEDVTVKMKTEKTRSANSPISSTFLIVTHYLVTKDKELPILNFQMDYKNANETQILGNAITQMLRMKINECKKGNNN